MRRISKYQKYTILLMSLILSLLFTGCHKDYIYIKNEFGRINAYNSSKTEVAFYKFIHIAKPPKNFGTSKTIFKKTTLYIYNIETGKLTEIYNFNNLPSGNWIQGISYRNNILAFSLRPISGWKYHKEYKEKYSGIHLYYNDQKKIIRFNPEGFYPELSPDESKLLYFTKDSISTVLWLSSVNNEPRSSKIISDTLSQHTKFIWKSDNELIFENEKILKKIDLSSLEITDADTSDLVYTDRDRISNKQLAELTKDFLYKDWGIDLNKSVPKSKKERINDIITGYSSPSYRMAAFQEIKESLTVKEIKMMLDKLERKEQRFAKKSIIEQLNILLDQKE